MFLNTTCYSINCNERKCSIFNSIEYLFNFFFLWPAIRPNFRDFKIRRLFLRKDEILELPRRQNASKMFSVVGATAQQLTLAAGLRREKWTVTWSWSCALACLTVVVVHSHPILKFLLAVLSFSEPTLFPGSSPTPGTRNKVALGSVRSCTLPWACGQSLAVGMTYVSCDWLLKGAMRREVNGRKRSLKTLRAILSNLCRHGV